MSAFESVNTALAPEPFPRRGEVTSTSTLRPNIESAALAADKAKLDDAKTPTKASFGALSTQKPLPEPQVPEPPVRDTPDNKKPLKRGGSSQYSAKSRDSEDVDMDDSRDDDDGSDEESVAADGTRTMKKKKSQRFFCTDYPPCNLSFTRSEHLARHIRKHTGERPFQCHCSRRFSRLDNLRQHAQTVHVNEEIPGDSLAATGTRFQRQIRTDRVRPPGNRSRASTGVIQPGQPRGHTRNALSASSVNSIGSIYGNRDEIRRRPPPLVMAGTRLPFDSYSSADGQYSSGFSTPASSRYSAGYDSPQWSSALGSPIRTHSRTASIYAGHRTPGRRLSVPSAENPFQSAHAFGPSSFGQPPLTPLSSGSREPFTPSGSILASPTSSMGSAWSRRESLTSAADDYRRRTWHHPESQLGFTSRLQSVMTPGYYPAGPPQAAGAPSSSATKITLPGIESFDALPRPATPPHRYPSPMMIDTPSRAPPPHHQHPADLPRPDQQQRRSTIQWETTLPRNFTRLEIARPDDASAWASDVNRAVQERGQLAQAEAVRPRLNFGPAVYPPQQHLEQQRHHPVSAPALTPRNAKRQGWYAGPLIPPAPPPQLQQQQQQQHGQRTSPERGGSSSSENGLPGTPTNPASPGEYGHPVIVQHHAPHEHEQQQGGGRPPPAYAAFPAAAIEQACVAARGKEDNGMMRLEALVAVATGERENAAAAAY